MGIAGTVKNVNGGLGNLIELVNKDPNKIWLDRERRIVTKRIGRKSSSKTKVHLPEDWFETYNRFQERTPYVVRIYKMTRSDEFTMEYLPNKGTVNEWLLERKANGLGITRLESIHLIKTIMSIVTAGIEFSEKLGDGCLWIHGDLELHNILVCSDGDDPMFKAIDPDSWWVWNNCNDIGLANDQAIMKLGNCIKRINDMISTIPSVLR